MRLLREVCIAPYEIEARQGSATAGQNSLEKPPPGIFELVSYGEPRIIRRAGELRIVGMVVAGGCGPASRPFRAGSTHTNFLALGGVGNNNTTPVL